MMGVLINPSSNSLPIIHSRDYRAFYKIMTGIGLFFDSIHSILSTFAPLELVFFLILFIHSHCLFFVCFSHPFIVTLILLGTKKLLILFLRFPMNELNEIFRIQAPWLFPTGE